MAGTRTYDRDEAEVCRKEWKELVDYCVRNNMAINPHNWQPIVAPLLKWRGRSVVSTVERAQKFPELDLNLSFFLVSVKQYRLDERYALRLFPEIIDDPSQPRVIVYFPTIYNRHSLNIQLTSNDIFSAICTDPKINYRVDLLFKRLTRAWPEFYVKLIPHGSLLTGLGTKKASLNVCIELDGPDSDIIMGDERKRGKPLPYSADAVLGLFYSDQATRESQTGFIRLTLDDSHPIELNFNKAITTEPTNLIMQYLKLDPRIKPFLFAIKYFGKSKSLFSPFYPKGIRYYPYEVMALAYLVQLDPPVIPNLQYINQYSDEDDCFDINCRSKYKYWDTVMNGNTKVGICARFHDCVRHEPTKPHTRYYVEQEGTTGRLYWNSANTMGVGELFHDFLHYYGYRFNFEDNAVSLKFGGRVPKKSDWMNDCIAIEDPFMSHVNLGQPIVDHKKFINTLRGSFTVLQSGTTFESMAKRIGEITRYDSQRGMDDERRSYSPHNSWGPSVTSKSFLLIDLPKETETSNYSDRIRKLFATHGDITKLLDLDLTTKQVFFNADTGNAKDIILPNSFVLDGKTVYIVELYNYFVVTEQTSSPMDTT